MTAEIVKVWGTADAYPLIFSRTENTQWKVSVPPDLADGQYACEIFAENNFGAVGHWTGILYMHCGKACIHLSEKRCSLWLKESNIIFDIIPPSVHMEPLLPATGLSLLPHTVIIFERSCRCAESAV